MVALGGRAMVHGGRATGKGHGGSYTSLSDKGRGKAAWQLRRKGNVNDNEGRGDAALQRERNVEEARREPWWEATDGARRG